jgi:RP/EB family microtubule-associated protein
VQRHVDVDKLIRAKYQDNLEFCQWLKAFYDQSGAYREDYDAKAVRAKGKGGKKYNDMMAKPGGGNKGRGASTGLSATSTATRKGATASASPRESTAKPRVPARTQRPAPTGKAPLKASSENKASVISVSKTENESAAADAELIKKNADLENKIKELESSIVDIEKERDFYFGKLRNVELLLQVKQDKSFEGCELESVVDSIFKILYATADEDVAVDEEGEVSSSPFLLMTKHSFDCLHSVCLT